MIAAFGISDAEELITYYEASGCLRTPRYAETIEFCRLLDSASERVSYESFGTSPQGRELPLVRVSNRRIHGMPEDSIVRVIVLACIHAGESDGKDAGFMLIRDFVRDGKLADEFKNVELLFVPIFNVDGHERFGPFNRINQNGPEEMGFRVTSQGYNLNRDFAKADSPEMRAFIRLFVSTMPHFLVDCHVTDGADYQYTVTYGLERLQNLAQPIRDWVNDEFLPTLDSRMEARGFPMIPYVTVRDYERITRGMAGIMWSPRYSTGYGTVQNRPSLLIETHMLKDYKTRVEGTYAVLEELVSYLAHNHSEVIRITREADSLTASLPSDLKYTNYTRTRDTTEIISFKGYTVTVDSSEVSGGDWVKWGTDTTTYEVPYVGTYEPSDSVEVPEAYIIPREWSEIADLLALHGVKIDTLKSETQLSVQTYRLSDVKWEREPNDGRVPVDSFTIATETTPITYPIGTYVITTRQRSARLIIHLLEPKSTDSLIRWGFFATIYDPKEYFESYVMENVAREMMASDPGLKTEFEATLAADSAFRSNPRERLDFFYKRSKYWDNSVGLYPIAKVMNFAGEK